MLIKGNTIYFNLSGKIYKKEGPSIRLENGDQEWWANGKLHREDGPAIINFNGDKFWFINNFLHREDGPAAEYANGYVSWWLNGKCHGRNNDFTNESWIKFVKTLVFY